MSVNALILLLLITYRFFFIGFSSEANEVKKIVGSFYWGAEVRFRCDFLSIKDPRYIEFLSSRSFINTEL
jgi:hypothetical protein